MPLPFSIAAVLVIIVCLFSKFSYPPTHFTSSIYAIIGLAEPVLNAYWIYLLWTQIKTSDLIVLLSIGALSCLYLVNLISLILANYVFCRDLRFKNWLSTGLGKCSYIFITFFSIFFSFKVTHIMFCKLFNLSVFKAKLQHPSRLFCLQLMTFLALSHSVWAIVMAAYNLYYSTIIASMLFF